MFFVGEFKYSLDQKGRVNIPAKYRKATADDGSGKYVIVYDEEINCLYVYSDEAFEKKFVSIIDQLSEAKKEHRAYMSMIGENATDAVLDKQGRITIPPIFLRKAGITKDVLIIGAFTKIEIWDPAAREAFKKKIGGPNAKAKLEEKISGELHSGQS
ncbi:MAG TPA: division/cell wall cluster transcriptional repressor MraZ [bacterium]|nr:division/cell wall cluster transcriptional repressor MraZ [bacterium]HDP99650.1 division/cell wall cluster transcriptional repressor MraZ [bacterium]